MRGTPPAVALLLALIGSIWRFYAAEASPAAQASFALPASAWWDEYYQPRQSRLSALQARLPDDSAVVEVVRSAQVEIDMFQRFSEHYSYAFYIVQPND